jgi:peroxin-1
MEEVAAQMDGFGLHDINNFFEQVLQHAAMREIEHLSDALTLTTEDFSRILETFKPLSLSKAKLKQSTVTWESIGGMHHPKAVLLETLKWPTLYPQIYANLPLRPRSGLLLFGYPGCGKTMLASAVSSACGLNFIAVNGPELLNKFIGASERAVREVFERAKSVKPCCLFFDEFDAIAPRRFGVA